MIKIDVLHKKCSKVTFVGGEENLIRHAVKPKCNTPLVSGKEQKNETMKFNNAGKPVHVHSNAVLHKEKTNIQRYSLP